MGFPCLGTFQIGSDSLNRWDPKPFLWEKIPVVNRYRQVALFAEIQQKLSLSINYRIHKRAIHQKFWLLLWCERTGSPCSPTQRIYFSLFLKYHVSLLLQHVRSKVSSLLPKVFTKSSLCHFPMNTWLIQNLLLEMWKSFPPYTPPNFSSNLPDT